MLASRNSVVNVQESGGGGGLENKDYGGLSTSRNVRLYLPSQVHSYRKLGKMLIFISHARKIISNTYEIILSIM